MTQTQPQPTFMQRCRAEWQRLNPHYLPETKGLLSVFKAAFREGWAAYFAPLRFVWWLVARSWRQRHVEANR